MSKKQIFLIVLLCVLVAGLTAGAYFFINKKSTKNNSSNITTNSGGGPIALGGTKADSIPLGGDSSKEDSNGLKVSDSAPTNSTQLGSGGLGQSTSSGTGANSSSSSSENTPGPETFGQYEQYKNNQNSLYGDIQVGTGGVATAGKKVGVIYKGWLTNGTLFDQSIDTTKPFVFTPGAGEVIKGWEESIVGMKVNGIRRIIVPPAVGYGTQAQGPIPANSLLVFDVQLIAVE